VCITAGAVQAIESPDRALVNEMLRMDKYIDMLIPRRRGLHKLCREAVDDSGDHRRYRVSYRGRRQR
jgi:gamma-glutamyl phosphate reductase